MFPQLLKEFIYLFLEREEGRERKRKRNTDVKEKHQLGAFRTHPDQTHNPGMRPAQESNRQPVVLRDDTQPTEPHWLGLDCFLNKWNYIFVCD